MFVDPSTDRALERIAARAADVRHAFTPGAMPVHDDVAIVPGAQPSLDALNVAPPADAFFITTDERGHTAYTRDGGCTLRDGTLVGANGRPMLGFRSPRGGPVELLIDPIDLALGRVRHPRIDAQGTFSYDRVAIDPRSGVDETQRVDVGRLALARFPVATKLAQSDASHVLAPPGVLPHLGRARDGTFGALAPMARATSGIDLDRSLERLQDAYLAFDALQAAHKAQGRVGKTTMDLVK